MKMTTFFNMAQLLKARIIAMILIGVLSANAYASDLHPQIWVTIADTTRIMDNIRNHQWASDLYTQLLSRIDDAVNIHKADPEFYTSRIPRTWGSCPNYTVISGGNGSSPPVYSASLLASEPTLHRVVDIYPTVSDNGNRISAISLEDIPSFNEDPKFGMNGEVSGGNYEFVSYLGRELRNIHTAFLELAVDCGIAYYLTGNDDYGQLAADILSGYTEALAPMVKGPDATGGGIVFPWDHLKGSRVMQRLPIIYDFVFPFISDPVNTIYKPVSQGVGSRVSFNFEAAQNYFVNQVNTVIERGIRGKNNWPVFESEVAFYCIICISDETIQNTLFNTLFSDGEERQTSTAELLDFFVDGVWPESSNYSFATNEIMLRIVNVLNRWKPEMKILENNLHLLDGPLKFADWEFPNGEFIRFGDAHRIPGDLHWQYEEALAASKQNGYTEKEALYGKLLKAAFKNTGGRDASWSNTTIQYIVPLKLLWGVDIEQYPEEDLEYRATSIASGQGIVTQRNYFTDDPEMNGLMCFSGGAAYVHSHATGIDMELYGKGFALGVEGGEDSNRSSSLHTNYLRVYAAHNTVIANGASRGEGGWASIAQDRVQTVALEPLEGEAPLTETFSFTRQFLDDNINNLDQERTVSIIRTSPFTGYYVDIFRSRSNDENNFHDYIYHNIGDMLNLISNDGGQVETTHNSSYYSTDIGDGYEQPGWKFFENVQTSAPLNEPVKARFDLRSDKVFMHAYIPEGNNLEISKAEAPPTIDAPANYKNTNTPVMIIRKNGEAWDHPFMVVYEPATETDASVQSVHPIYAWEKVVGVEVRSAANYTSVTDYIFFKEDDDESLVLPDMNILFEGRYGIVRVEQRGGLEQVTLYLGDGKKIIYGTDTLVADEKNQGLKIIGDLPPVVDRTGKEIIIALEAEDYDEGGEGVAYHDYDAGNSGGAYRHDDVDIEKNPAASNDHAVVQFKGGDWMKYTFEADSSCNYELSYYAACRNNDNAIVNFFIDDSLQFGGSSPVNRTYDWNLFERNAYPDSIFLEKGTHVFRLNQGASLSNNPDKIVLKHGQSEFIPDTATNFRTSNEPLSGYYSSDVVTIEVTAENGSVSISPELDVYLIGNEITIEAIPAEGYLFDGWSGDTVSNENPLVLTMDSSVNITAGFILETSTRTWSTGELLIYPNPSNGVFHVQSKKFANGSYQIYALSGHKIKEGIFSENESIDMWGYAKGLYLLKITASESVHYQKILLE